MDTLDLILTLVSGSLNFHILTFKRKVICPLQILGGKVSF